MGINHSSCSFCSAQGHESGASEPSLVMDTSPVSRGSRNDNKAKRSVPSAQHAPMHRQQEEKERDSESGRCELVNGANAIRESHIGAVATCDKTRASRSASSNVSGVTTENSSDYDGNDDNGEYSHSFGNTVSHPRVSHSYDCTEELEFKLPTSVSVNLNAELQKEDEQKSTITENDSTVPGSYLCEEAIEKSAVRKLFAVPTKYCVTTSNQASHTPTPLVFRNDSVDEPNNNVPEEEASFLDANEQTDRSITPFASSLMNNSNILKLSAIDNISLKSPKSPSIDKTDLELEIGHKRQKSASISSLHYAFIDSASPPISQYKAMASKSINDLSDDELDEYSDKENEEHADEEPMTDEDDDQCKQQVNDFAPKFYPYTNAKPRFSARFGDGSLPARHTTPSLATSAQNLSNELQRDEDDNAELSMSDEDFLDCVIVEHLRNTSLYQQQPTFGLV